MTNYLAKIASKQVVLYWQNLFNDHCQQYERESSVCNCFTILCTTVSHKLVS